MHPILIRSFTDEHEQLAGFEQVTPGHLDLLIGLSKTHVEYWNQLPQQFKFEEIAGKIVPRSTLSRLIKAVSSLGALAKGDDGIFRKTVTE
jgi:hypothetical protein